MPPTLPIAKNVFGEPLVPCSFKPLTGYFRDGCCKTNEDDVGTHVTVSYTHLTLPTNREV